jgi:hypothetical protein
MIQRPAFTIHLTIGKPVSLDLMLGIDREDACAIVAESVQREINASLLTHPALRVYDITSSFRELQPTDQCDAKPRVLVKGCGEQFRAAILAVASVALSSVDKKPWSTQEPKQPISDPWQRQHGAHPMAQRPVRSDGATGLLASGQKA